MHWLFADVSCHTCWLWEGFHKEEMSTSQGLKILLLYFVFCLGDVMLPCPGLALHISEGSVFLGIALVRFTSIQQGFICLFQQEIWPLAFITSIFSLNTVLSLYLHSVSHVFQSLPFCVHLLDWSRTIFPARVVCYARHRSANKNSGWQ